MKRDAKRRQIIIWALSLLVVLSMVCSLLVTLAPSDSESHLQPAPVALYAALDAGSAAGA